MKRQVILLFCLITLLLPYTVALTPVQAATPSISARVSVNRLRVRDVGSLQGKIITVVRVGQMFRVLGCNAQRTWLKIQLSNGVAGWVSTAMVRLQGAKLKDVPVVN